MPGGTGGRWGEGGGEGEVQNRTNFSSVMAKVRHCCQHLSLPGSDSAKTLATISAILLTYTDTKPGTLSIH